MFKVEDRREANEEVQNLVPLVLDEAGQRDAINRFLVIIKRYVC